jgi:hypothetical protein
MQYEKKSWLDRSFHNHDLDTAKIEAISSKILLFLEIMLDELFNLNFSGPDFLQKAELFSRSILMTYDKKDFIELLNIMLEVYPQFYTTKFYMGLIALRKVCCLEFNEPLPGLDKIPKGILPELHQDSEIDYNSIFFITHLVLNIANAMTDARSNPSIYTLPSEQIKIYIIKMFPDIYNKTMAWIKAQHV